MEKKEHVEVVDSADNSTPQLKAKSDPKPINPNKQPELELHSEKKE